jgi:glycosyltransferase involved in cell wall biosynthesis
LKLGVVVPCYRQEAFLPRTIEALERSLAGSDWRGALVIAAPSGAPLPALSSNWRVLAPPVSRPLTPGGARMLGFSDCGGDWVLFVDADVEIDEVWLSEALAVAARADGAGEPANLAGLWGRLEEWFVTPSGERAGNPDLYRVGRDERDTDYTATLSFYRRDALTSAGGYDARLHSEEDFELGMRIRRLGLRLRSLGRCAGRHWSGPRPSFSEIARRWRTGLCFGMGEALRLYLGRPGFLTLLRRQLHYLVMLALWLAGLVALGLDALTKDGRWLSTWALAPLARFVFMTFRKRSPKLALHSMLTWTVNGAGLVAGFVALEPPAEPLRPGART